MDFWGVQVKAGITFPVVPQGDNVIQASLGEAKAEETVNLYVTVEEKRFCIGTLSQGKTPQITFDLVFSKTFELSHDRENGSVDFVGFISPNVESDDVAAALADDLNDYDDLNADFGDNDNDGDEMM